MARSSTSERNSYRRSSRSHSPSASSVVTVKGADSSRAYSNSRSGLSANVSQGSSDELGVSVKRRSSVAGSRSSGSGSKSSVKASDDPSNGHYSRWSQSSSSSHATAEHRRHSSFSKRFSFGPSSSSVRTSSPTKKRRPADINTDGLMPKPLQSSTTVSKPFTDHLSAPVTTLLSLKVGDSPLDAGPRTPLLDIGQISAANDGRYSPRTLHPKQPRTSPNTAASKSSGSPLDSQRDHQWDRGSTEPLKIKQKYYYPSDATVTGAKAARGPSPPQQKSRKDKDKKSMLARALQRANDAVQLDNAQDYMGAVGAYEEACEYLTQVLSKSSTDDDKQKLATIRETYTTRIQELQQLDSQWQPPKIQDTFEPQTHEQQQQQQQLERGLEQGVVQEPEREYDYSQSYDADAFERAQKLSTPVTWSEDAAYEQLQSDTLYHSSLSLLDFEPGPTVEMDDFDDEQVHYDMQPTNPASLAPPSQSDMPPPLSPRRPPPPIPSEPSDTPTAPEYPKEYDPRRESALIGSYIETQAEETGKSHRLSHGSSHHSVSSENGIHRKHLRTQSSNTEAEFDAALDAAVEAAYDEGYEPYSSTDESYSRDYLARASLINPPSHPEEYYAQRDSIIAAAKAHTAHRHSMAQHQVQSSREISESFSGMDSDEEERLLDEVTDDIATEEAKQNSPAKSTIPRQSDSSSSSGRTWISSIASSVNTAGTSLSTVDEHVSPSKLQSKQLPSLPPPAPPPTGALPNIPTKEKQHAPPPLPAKSAQQRDISALVPPQSPSVQDRRSSSAGQKMKRLKIETAVPSRHAEQPRSFETALSLPKRPHTSTTPSSGAPSVSTGPSPDVASLPSAAPPSTGATPSSFPVISAPFPTPFQCNFPDETSSSMSTPALTSAKSNDSSIYRPSPQSASPVNPFQARSIDHGLLKSHSSLSLRQKGLLTPAIDSFETSPGTPTSLNFSTVHNHLRNGFASTASASAAVTPVQPVEDLFANEIHSSQEPSSKPPFVPRPLEPCPESQLLRPFWLMRRFQQTIVHPRGGYLSLRIFIPREVWKVKNVKLKYVEDKVANCDLLTAALLKLGMVDTLDADAVLEEMQAFESVLDQAQTNLVKKLGNEVGAQSIGSLFKDAPVSSPISSDNPPATAGDTSSTGGTSQGARTSSKSYLASWRKLRSKNSSANLHAAHQKSDPLSKDTTTMSSVPMTSSSQGMSTRVTKKDEISAGLDVKTDGPHASYMSALARLCDAVQILDQIARQVEDPGLKHSSSTHVGLELCARHAAEFFAFYICRFVLQDITMLADKFIKRASEWVLT